MIFEISLVIESSLKRKDGETKCFVVNIQNSTINSCASGPTLNSMFLTKHQVRKESSNNDRDLEL